MRIALGATAGDVTRLVLWQSLRAVGAGLLIGGGMAWSLATLLMSTPAAARIGDIVRVFDPLAYAVSLLVHRHGLRARGVGTRAARRTHRSDRHAASGVARAPVAAAELRRALVWHLGSGQLAAPGRWVSDRTL